jgi:hypothetical protein
MILLLAAGIGFILAGLLAIGFGVPVKEFGFGNTLILSGVIATGTGAILIGLHAAVRELKAAAGRATDVTAELPRAPARLRLPIPDAPEADEPAAADDGFLFPRDQPHKPAPRPAHDNGSPPLSASDASPAPWQEEASARDRARERDAPPSPEPAAEPAVKPRRNLLFSSSSRKERERMAKTGESGSAEPEADTAAPNAGPPPRTFEEAWPEPERARPELPRRVRPPPAPGQASEPASPTPEQPAVAAPSPEPPQVTILKSGVVDGMAYSLYSDGSIEAQMPEGMMRFASIDELRSHLDQRP